MKRKENIKKEEKIELKQGANIKEEIKDIPHRIWRLVAQVQRRVFDPVAM